MGKKLTPSGYQIIDIDVSDQTSGVAFTPRNEDEKILHSILSSREFRKPILLKIKTSGYELMGFTVTDSLSISLTYGSVGSSITEVLYIDGDNLAFDEIEE